MVAKTALITAKHVDFSAAPGRDSDGLKCRQQLLNNRSAILSNSLIKHFLLTKYT